MRVQFKRALSIGGVSYKMGQAVDLTGQRDELLGDWFFAACVKDGHIVVTEEAQQVKAVEPIVSAVEYNMQVAEIVDPVTDEAEKPKRGRPSKDKGE